MGIKYCGPAHDYSGYGEAVRHDIGALIAAGITVKTQIPKYCLEISDFGYLGKLASDRVDADVDYKIKIIHTTPNVYRQYLEEGKYHIGRVFWETDKLPAEFAVNCQLLDEIWTGSEFNANAIKKAGVTKPIFIIPEAIDTNINIGEIEPYKIRNMDDYKFYSIFEWTDRKNPTALLEAFWMEFEQTQNVSLTIKTYIDNFTPEKKTEITTNIRRIKNRLSLARYAPLFLYTNLMDRKQIYRFHSSFDCFVSAHRGEGWGIPQMEALFMAKPIISTNCGGIHEYLDDAVDARLIKYQMVPLSGNNRNQQWYQADQEWAEVDKDDLRHAMRWVYENQTQAREIGINGQKKVKNLFSLDAIGMKMANRLDQLYAQNGF